MFYFGKYWSSLFFNVLLNSSNGIKKLSIGMLIYINS